MDIVKRKMVGSSRATAKKTRSTAGRATMPSNLGFHYLLVLNVDLEKWCEKYCLEPYWGECADCDAKLYVDQPFISKKRRGLIAKPCSCGSRHVPFSFIDIGYDEVNLNYLGKAVGNSISQASQEKLISTMFLTGIFRMGGFRDDVKRLKYIDTVCKELGTTRDLLFSTRGEDYPA